MTPEKQRAAREACDKATAGPWRPSGDGKEVYARDPHGFTGPYEVADCSCPETVGPIKTSRDPDTAKANAAFIALARTALPTALDEIERQAAEIERLREAIREFTDRPPLHRLEKRDVGKHVLLMGDEVIAISGEQETLLRLGVARDEMLAKQRLAALAKATPPTERT